MTLHAWWVFLSAVFVLSAIPGPNMLLILSRSIEAGFVRSTAAMSGSLSALLIVLFASMAGLTTLFMAIPGAFEVLRYAGVAYLFYLGVKAWRSPVSHSDSTLSTVTHTPSSRAKLFRSGFITCISNPKFILFTVAFFPQFINPLCAQTPQFLTLIATFAVVESFWYCLYALGGRSLALYLQKPAIKQRFNRVTSIIFWGFGLLLLRTSR